MNRRLLHPHSSGHASAQLPGRLEPTHVRCCESCEGPVETGRLRWRAGNWATHFFAFNLALRLICAAAAPVPPVEKLLPDDTLAVVTAPDFPKLQALLRQAPLRQLWNDPAMKPFRDKFIAKWQDEIVKPLERDLDLRFADFAGLPQGQFTVAFTQDSWDGKSDAEPAFLLLLDAKEKSGQLRTNLVDIRKKWVDAGKTLRTEKIRDVEFAILTLTTNDTPKTLKKFLAPATPPAEGESGAVKQPEKKSELAIGQWESLLIIGSSLKPVEKVVAHVTGGAAPALAEVATFEADRLAQFRDAPLYAWVNVKLIVEVFNKVPVAKPSPVAGEAPPVEIKTLLAACGFAGVRTLAGSYRDTGDGTMLQLTCAAPAGERTGLFKMLAAEARDAAPPPFVPADAVKFQRVRLDCPKVWAAFEKMLGDISPSWARVLNDLVTDANKEGRKRDAGFDVNRDIIANLGDDLMWWRKPPRGNTLDQLNNPPGALLLSSPNAEKLALSLRSFFAAVMPQASQPQEREFLGRKIYSATPPLFAPPESAKAPPPVVHYAASGGYVGFSQDVALLEEWLRSGENPPKPLRDAAGLTDAIQKAGGAGGGWLAYESQAELARAMFETLKKDAGAATNAIAGGALAGSVNLPAEGRGLLDWLDFSLLPPWESVARYFHFTVTTGSANAEGLTYRYFSPTPPGLKKQPLNR